MEPHSQPITREIIVKFIRLGLPDASALSTVGAGKGKMMAQSVTGKKLPVSEQLESWLRDQPVEFAQVIAMRTALQGFAAGG